MIELRVSVLELPARWAEPDRGLAEIDALLGVAPTDLAIVPELALTGYLSPEGDADLAPYAEPLDGPTIRRASAIAARHQVHLVVPLVLAEEGRRYNASVVLGPDGAVRATYRKRHPWLPERWATPGAAPSPIVDVGGIGVALAICYDGHFLPYDAATVLARADLLAFTSAWVDEEQTRIPLLRSIAQDFGVAVANANWGAGDPLVPGQGGSCVLDPRGRVVAAVAPGGTPRADAIVASRA